MALLLKNLPAIAREARDISAISKWARSSGGGNGNPLQCSCLGNAMDRGAWWATVNGVAQSPTKQQLSTRGRERSASLLQCFQPYISLQQTTGEKEGGRPGLVSEDNASFPAQLNCTTFFQ